MVVLGIQAGHIGEVLAAVLEEALARADRDLFQGLEAIGGEARSHDREVFDAGARLLQDRLVGVGPQPLLAAEA